MGFRFRKSTKIGPVRLNFSKKGVGWSVGGPGYRYTKKAGGGTRTTLSAPGTGISYVAECSGKVQNSSHAAKSREFKNVGFGKKIILIMCILVITICIVAGLFGDKYSKTELEQYTDLDIINMEHHPRVFASSKSVENFYDNLGDSRIMVTGVRNHSMRMTHLANKGETHSDPVILYFIKSASNENIIGGVELNLAGIYGMNLDEALYAITQYLPPDFSEKYKLDCSFIANNVSGVEKYVYACRRNESPASPNYPYYYGFIITHDYSHNSWSAETTVAAYGDYSLGWIQTYGQPWDIDLTNYF